MESYKFVGPTFTDIQSWVAMEHLADTPSGDPMHNIYLFIGAVWNSATGFWEINGLMDVTNTDIQNIYFESISHKTDIYRQFAGILSRSVTMIVNEMSSGNNLFDFANFFARSQSLESIRICRPSVYGLVDIETIYLTNLRSCFERCSKLRSIKGNLICRDVKNANLAFDKCYELQDIKISKLGISVSFAQSPKLSLESMLHMISNAQDVQLTITLHPDAYVLAIADAGIQAALATHPNLSLASA